MINFFKKKEINSENETISLSKVASLLIHCAKIDENFTEKEEEIIKKTLIELGAKNSDIDKLILDSKIIE